MCAINLLVMNGCCSGGSHSAFVTGVQYWPKGRWTACARATLYVRYDRETKRLTASILTSSFQSWLKLLFMKPVVLLSRQLSQWADGKGHFTRAPQKSCWHLFSIFNIPQYELQSRGARHDWICTVRQHPVRNHCLVQLREALLLAKLWVAPLM